jgi:hypothetical protein
MGTPFKMKGFANAKKLWNWTRQLNRQTIRSDKLKKADYRIKENKI